jgi:indole-3-glycerol phosphate synthase
VSITTSSVLDDILATTRVVVAAAKARLDEASLRTRLEAAPAARDFRAVLARPGLHLIAEMKRRSPSAGELRDPYQPARLAEAFTAHGAAALSVLTETAHFGGALDDLAAARRASHLPVLRKDFVIDPYQLVEARLAGADAVLLICAILPDRLLVELLDDARALGLCALVEVHDAEEVERALAAGADVVGINNRDLRTLRTDPAITALLRPLIPPDRLVISESGIRSRHDLDRLRELGVHAVLVGEAILRSADLEAKVRELASLDPH